MNVAIEFTETQLFHAWRLLEAVGRGRTSNVDERVAAVAPAMAILETQLNDLGFSVVDNTLVPTPAEEPSFEEPPPEEEPEEEDSGDPEASPMTKSIRSRSQVSHKKK